MLRDQEGSIISNQDLSHGPQPRKPHSRARLRDLGRTWLCARPSRSALACGRAGNPGGIHGRARPPTRPAKGAPVACTFESRQEPCAGQLNAAHAPLVKTPVRGPQADREIAAHAAGPKSGSTRIVAQACFGAIRVARTITNSDFTVLIPSPLCRP